MEDEEDVVASPAIEEPLQTELEKSVTVSTAGDSPENPPLAAAEEVIAQPSVVGDGEAVAIDERESEVETVEVSKMERIEDVTAADESLLSPVVEVGEELAAVEVAEGEEGGIGANDVEKSKPTSEEKVGVEESEGVEGVDSINEVKNVEKPIEESVGLLVAASEARDELTGECVQVSEGIGAGNVDGKNVGNVEELVKVDEEMEVKNGEGNEEALSNAEEGGVDGGVVAEQVTPASVEKVGGDEGVKVGEIGGEEREGLLCANEVEGDGISRAEDVQMVDETAVKTDELVEDEEQRKEVEVKEEDEGSKVAEEVEEEESKEEEVKEDDGIVNSPTGTKNDELLVMEKGDGTGNSATVTKNDELIKVEKIDGMENSPTIMKNDESMVVENDGVQNTPAVMKNDESMVVGEDDGVEKLPTITENDESMIVEEDGMEKSSKETKNYESSIVKEDDVMENSPTIRKIGESIVEEDAEMEKSAAITKNDESNIVEEDDGMDNSPTITKNDESIVVEEDGGKEKSSTTTKNDESRIVEEEDGTENSATITKNDVLIKVEKDDGMENSPTKMKNDESMVVEGTPIAESEIKKEAGSVKSGSGSGGKRKRGRNAGEDVCFICLDGGDLVLCDHRGCPKAYHPSCVDHDDEFFKTKGNWNCGWHLCNQCGKNAYFMCYTCQFSLCKACSKDATIFCVKGKKGFCESCMKTITMIENSEKNETDQPAFSDKSSWEYLFKDYWLEQKEKFCITSDELSQAKNPWKDSHKQKPSAEVHEGNNDAGSDSDSSQGRSELSDSRRKKPKKSSKSVDYNSDVSSEKKSPGKRKSKRRLRSHAKEVNSDSEQSSPDTNSRKGRKARKLAKSRSKGVKYGSADDFPEGEWASKELLEFVMHMKNGDDSVLTQFDVQELLLEYIKRNKLRDPRRQSQIICDSMLQKLFGKPRVGHFEMLKLLESHFFLKDAGDNQGTVADTETRQLDTGDNTDSLLDSGKCRGKKSRKREDRGSQSNHDDYAAIDMHNINLIFLRRNLMEGLMDNSETFHDKAVGTFVRIRISGSGQKQDIYRLVQITGTSKAAEPYKVGKRTTDIMLEILNLDKTETISIDTVSNQEFSEDECKRLRQSIKCGLINRMTVGDVVEKARELQEVRVLDWLEAEIVRLSHLRDRASEKGRKKELRECVEKLQLLKTPEERQRRLDETPVVHADPKMDPSYESGDDMDTTRRASDTRPRDSGFSRRGRDNFSSLRGTSASSDSWSVNARPPSQKWEPNRNSSGKSFSGRREELVFASPTRDRPWSNGADKGSPRFNSTEKPGLTPESKVRAEHSGLRSHMSTTAAASQSPRPSTVAGQTDLKINETEKMWHYRDPAGKVQGPFSMTQLRKWSNTGYFPTDLRVWRISQTENDSILLTNILGGRLDKEVPSVTNATNVPSSIDTSKLSVSARSSEGSGRYESSNLYSPTPSRSSFQSSNQSRGIERFPSPTPTSPSDPIRHSSVPRKSKWDAPRNSGENFASSVVQQTAGQHSFPASASRPDLSSTSGNKTGQQMGGQSYTTPNTVMNPSNLAQVLSNVMQQPATGQNPSAYAHGWSSGYTGSSETVNAGMAPNNPNAVPAQVTYGQWSTVSVNNQAPSYGTGYAAPGNMAGPPAQNAWGPPSMNMPWNGQQQQIINPNMVWTGPPTVPGAMRPGGTPPMNWPGAVPGPSPGTANTGWVAPPGTANTGWVAPPGDPNRNGGVAQWNRQSSNGS
ncbi:hypothetical protein RND81_09G170400 [Saponaria officinalis]|uniref:Zinc finger CCCH domain-containing protein 19 n=2 Tax=Saponaria officinalis TaxID=3572 RepID=A0AAW1INC3_SAPOF